MEPVPVWTGKAGLNGYRYRFGTEKKHGQNHAGLIHAGTGPEKITVAGTGPDPDSSTTAEYFK